MRISKEKKEIIKWITSIDDPAIIERIKNIKDSDTKSIDFEKEWEMSVTVKEARLKTFDFLKSLPWEK